MILFWTQLSATFRPYKLRSVPPSVPFLPRGHPGARRPAESPGPDPRGHRRRGPAGQRVRAGAEAAGGVEPHGEPQLGQAEERTHLPQAGHDAPGPGPQTPGAAAVEDRHRAPQRCGRAACFAVPTVSTPLRFSLLTVVFFFDIFFPLLFYFYCMTMFIREAL